MVLRMDSLKILLFGGLVGIVLLQGCTMTSSTDSDPIESATEEVTYVPRDDVTAQERFREALNLLQRGFSVPARIELEQYLKEKPGSAVAVSLLGQIDTPSEEYFPSDYQQVRLAPGQSLSTLSKLYLGSIYKFHALAKYNDINEPNRLRIGQTVRIPLTPRAVAAFAEDEDKSSQAAEKKPDVVAPAPIEVAAELAPETAEPQYIVLPRQRPALGSDMEPEPAMDSEELEAMESSSDLDAEAAPAISQEVEQLHREALDAYRAHKLDLAIELWDQVLFYDEDHENARLYRAQAIGLKNKLRDLR